MRSRKKKVNYDEEYAVDLENHLLNENKSKKVSGFTLTNIIKKLDDFSEKVKVGASFSETTK